MKRFFMLVLCLMFLGLACRSGLCGMTSGSATASVIVTINPNVAVGVITPIVDAGTVQTGAFAANLGLQD